MLSWQRYTLVSWSTNIKFHNVWLIHCCVKHSRTCIDQDFYKTVRDECVTQKCLYNLFKKLVQCLFSKYHLVNSMFSWHWYSLVIWSTDIECHNVWMIHYCREYWRGKYHCTIELLFDWFWSVCFANKNKNCQIPNQSNRRSTVQWYFPL